MQIRGQHIAPVFRNTMIPRLQILCGSRLKPEMAIDSLKLKNVIHEDIVDGKRVGRVSIVSGDYEFKRDKKNGVIRLTVGETQMGLDAVDIIQREYAYCADGTPVVQIRSGTSGGMNTRDLDAPVMDLGDIVIARTNIGRSGALEQSLGYFPKIIPDVDSARELADFIKMLEQLNIRITSDGRFYEVKNDVIVVKALENAAKGLGYKYLTGKNFSKESLNAEGAEGLMLRLREKDGVLISEMEQLQNAYIAAFTWAKYNVKVLSGMVVAVIGAVPGPGFPDPKNKVQMKLQEDTENKALLISAEALADLSRLK